MKDEFNFVLSVGHKSTEVAVGACCLSPECQLRMSRHLLEHCGVVIYVRTIPSPWLNQSTEKSNGF